MSEQNQDLEKVEPKPQGKNLSKVGFHNQANQKAAGRGQMLEALTGSKGAKLGKRGLIYKIMLSLERDLDSEDPDIYQPARAEALKMALAMTKDDKAGQSLNDLLAGAANVQINFNNHFSQRSGNDQAIPAHLQGLTIGFTPPPGPGDRPPSD